MHVCRGANEAEGQTSYVFKGADEVSMYKLLGFPPGGGEGRRFTSLRKTAHRRSQTSGMICLVARRRRHVRKKKGGLGSGGRRGKSVKSKSHLQSCCRCEVGAGPPELTGRYGSAFESVFCQKPQRPLPLQQLLIR